VKPHLYTALAAAFVLTLVPHIVFAQSTTPATGCGAFGSAFNSMSQGMNAVQSFFYGPFFKIGCLVAFAVGGLMLLFDDGQLNAVAKWIIRGIVVVAFVLAVASFLNINGGTC
jgi:type IV secretory pathway VirB2 component (pilin)